MYSCRLTITKDCLSAYCAAVCGSQICMATAALLGDPARQPPPLPWPPPAEHSYIVLRQLLPALARVFALPAQQLQPGSNEQQRADEDLQRRLLAVQLEALHVLLLLLPLPQAALTGSSPLGHGALWPAQLRQGLGLLLRGRISAVQRHSALQLAAAVVDMAGPGWLLGGSSEGLGNASSTASSTAGAAARAQDGEAFFQLLVEVVKVETSVLLHDALAPSVPVPLASAAAPAAGDWRPPAPRAARAPSEGGSSEAGDGDHAAGAALAADLADVDASGAAADVEPLLRVLASEQDRKELEEQLRREQREAAAAQPQAPQPGERMRRVDETPIPAGRYQCVQRGTCKAAPAGGVPLSCCTFFPVKWRTCLPLSVPDLPRPRAHPQRCTGRDRPSRRAPVPPACCPPASPCWRRAWRRWLPTRR